MHGSIRVHAWPCAWVHQGPCLALCVGPSGSMPGPVCGSIRVHAWPCACLITTLLFFTSSACGEADGHMRACHGCLPCVCGRAYVCRAVHFYRVCAGVHMRAVPCIFTVCVRVCICMPCRACLLCMCACAYACRVVHVYRVCARVHMHVVPRMLTVCVRGRHILHTFLVCSLFCMLSVCSRYHMLLSCAVHGR